MRFWRHLVQRFSPVLLALSLVLFGMGAPLHAAPTTATQIISASSHCSDSSAAVNLPTITDCLSHCALPAPLAIAASVTQIQSERPTAPLIAWQVISIAPPSPPPRSDA